MNKKLNQPKERHSSLGHKQTGPFDKAQVRLRRRAERALTKKPEGMDGLTDIDVRKLIHELQVHQIELDMQNEELRQAQLELEESRNKYADLYDFAPVGYFILNKKGMIEEVNLTGATLLGVERKRLLKQRMAQFISKEDEDLFHSYQNRLLENANQQTCELKMIKGDGTEFYAQLEGTGTFDNDGNFNHFRISLLDITLRKQAEKSLRTVHNELERMVREKTKELLKANETLQTEIADHKEAEESLQESLLQLSKKNRYERIISSVTRSVNQSLEPQDVLDNAVEALKQNIDGADNTGIFMVEGKEAVLKAYRGYPEWFVARVRRIPYPKGGTWRAIIEGKPRYVADTDQDEALGPAGRELGIKSYLFVPINSQGKVAGAIGIVSFQRNPFDEEELKLLELVAGQIEIAINNAHQAEELKRSEERYRSLFDQSSVGIYIFDKKFKITQCNERFVQILGSSRDKVIGLDLLKVNDQSFTHAMEEVFEGQSVHHESFYEATTSSTRLWLSVHFSPLFDSSGNVYAGMAVVEDITDRKRVEEELAKVQKLESLGTLAGGIAHDFNNVLTGILGNISLAKIYKESPDKMVKRLTEAENACLRAKGLTQQLLTFSRGGAPIKKRTFITGLIKNSANLALTGSDIRCEFQMK